MIFLHFVFYPDFEVTFNFLHVMLVTLNQISKEYKIQSKKVLNVIYSKRSN